MTHFVYILQSLKDGKNYIGSTADVEKRLLSHNLGRNRSTSCRAPFIIIYKKEFSDKLSALRYERWLKNQKGGITVKQLIADWQKANK